MLYAFVHQESSDILAKIMEIFADFMGESVGQTKVAVTEMVPNEISAIKRYLHHASRLLCAFHVHKVMKARLQKLQCLKEVKDHLHQLAYALVTMNDIATFHKHNEMCSLCHVFYQYISNHWLHVQKLGFTMPASTVAHTSTTLTTNAKGRIEGLRRY